MAFVNVNKVTLEDTNNSKEAVSSAVLLLASLIYDEVKEGKYDKALGQMEGLKHAVMCLDSMLKNDITKNEVAEETLKDTQPNVRGYVNCKACKWYQKSCIGKILLDCTKFVDRAETVGVYRKYE